jgi:hypothetical protein
LAGCQHKKIGQERERRLGRMRKLALKVYTCYEELEMDGHDCTIDCGNSVPHTHGKGVDVLDKRGLFR